MGERSFAPTGYRIITQDCRGQGQDYTFLGLLCYYPVLDEDSRHRWRIYLLRP
ncbi:MAG: hypothetical protein K6360_06500 [Deltaproteobacteria bacterium]